MKTKSFLLTFTILTALPISGMTDQQQSMPKISHDGKPSPSVNKQIPRRHSVPITNRRILPPQQQNPGARPIETPPQFPSNRQKQNVKMMMPQTFHRMVAPIKPPNRQAKQAVPNRIINKSQKPIKRDLNDPKYQPRPVPTLPSIKDRNKSINSRVPVKQAARQQENNSGISKNRISQNRTSPAMNNRKHKSNIDLEIERMEKIIDRKMDAMEKKSPGFKERIRKNVEKLRRNSYNARN